MTLAEALAAIAPALIPTPRFATVPVVFKNGYIAAYNGDLTARAPLDAEFETVALDGEKLRKVWTEGSKFKVNDVFVTISRPSATFRLLKTDPNLVMIPDFVMATAPLSSTLRDSILLAREFASMNAMHAWACGVSIDPAGVTATNNQVLVRVPCESEFTLTLPVWALKTLRDDKMPYVGWNESTVCFRYDNGLEIQAQRLSAEMPVVVGQIAAQTKEAHVPLQYIGSLSALEELSPIEGRFVTLDNGRLTILGENGEEAIAECEARSYQVTPFKLSIETARLVFAHATHLDFSLAPDRLVFSKDTYPRMYGFAAGVR